MGDEREPPPLDELGDRLRAAREPRKAGRQNRGKSSGDTAATSGIGTAIRAGVDMVAGLVVGLGIGWLLDYWLDTRPWLLLLFATLGFGAGILNVYRTAMGYGLAVGYRDGDGDDGADTGRPDKNKRPGADERPDGGNGRA